MQLSRWRDFRTWQIDNRAQEQTPGPSIQEQVDEQERRHRPPVFEVRGGTFAQYTDAVNRRLARHGQPAVELLQDPEQQSELTTWMEYLNFEYWWFNAYVTSLARQQTRHDKAWKAIKDSGVLPPPATQESTHEMKLAALRVHVGRNDEALLAKIWACQSALMERNRLRSRVGCHRLIVEWVASQVPLIVPPGTKRPTKCKIVQSEDDTSGRRKRICLASTTRVIKQPQALRRSARIAARQYTCAH